MASHETLFLNTLNDLKEKLEKGDEYSLLRAAGLIRHLLLDENPLVPLVNKTYKVKILYRVKKRKKIFQDEQIIDGVKWETVIGVTFVNPAQNDEHNEYLKLPEFLKYEIIFYAGKNFTVLDIIRLCSHIYGGIHSGTIKEEKDIYLNWANLTVAYADDIQCGVGSIKDIIMIILNALQPLGEEIKKDEQKK